jgi:hypothetical protein
MPDCQVDPLHRRKWYRFSLASKHLYSVPFGTPSRRHASGTRTLALSPTPLPVAPHHIAAAFDFRAV